MERDDLHLRARQCHDQGASRYEPDAQIMNVITAPEDVTCDQKAISGSGAGLPDPENHFGSATCLSSEDDRIEAHVFLCFLALLLVLYYCQVNETLVAYERKKLPDQP